MSNSCSGCKWEKSYYKELLPCTCCSRISVDKYEPMSVSLKPLSYCFGCQHDFPCNHEPVKDCKFYVKTSIPQGAACESSDKQIITAGEELKEGDAVYVNSNMAFKCRPGFVKASCTCGEVFPEKKAEIDNKYEEAMEDIKKREEPCDHEWGDKRRTIDDDWFVITKKCKKCGLVFVIDEGATPHSHPPRPSVPEKFHNGIIDGQMYFEPKILNSYLSVLEEMIEKMRLCLNYIFSKDKGE